MEKKDGLAVESAYHVVLAVNRNAAGFRGIKRPPPHADVGTLHLFHDPAAFRLTAARDVIEGTVGKPADVDPIQQEKVMSNNVPSHVKLNAISANLKALQALLIVATTRCTEAQEFIRAGDCNGAMGTVLELDAILTDAKALYAAAIALHR